MLATGQAPGAAGNKATLGSGPDDGQAAEEEWLPKRQKGRGQVKQRGSTRCPHCINILEAYELCLRASQQNCAKVVDEGLACESYAFVAAVTLHIQLLACRRLKNGMYVIPVTATHAAVSSAMALHTAQQRPMPAAVSEGSSPHTAPSSAPKAAAAVIAAAAAALPGGIAGVSVTQAACALEAVLAAADVAMTDHELRARWRAQMPNELHDADGSDDDMFSNQVSANLA